MPSCNHDIREICILINAQKEKSSVSIILNPFQSTLSIHPLIYLPNRQLILPLGIDLTLLKKALPLQPLPIRLVPLLPAIFLEHIERIIRDFQKLFEFLDVLVRGLEFGIPQRGGGCGGGIGR